MTTFVTAVDLCAELQLFYNFEPNTHLHMFRYAQLTVAHGELGGGILWLLVPTRSRNVRKGTLILFANLVLIINRSPGIVSLLLYGTFVRSSWDLW